MLGKRSYTPNSTETQAYHQISACCTRPDRVQCGIISVWHWKGPALKVLMGGHHLIELDQHGADEDKLTYKANAFVGACYGKVEIYTTNHRYQMRKSKIVDPIRYG